jgi:hypothetical protein
LKKQSLHKLSFEEAKFVTGFSRWVKGQAQALEPGAFQDMGQLRSAMGQLHAASAAAGFGRGVGRGGGAAGEGYKGRLMGVWRRRRRQKQVLNVAAEGEGGVHSFL